MSYHFHFKALFVKADRPVKKYARIGHGLAFSLVTHGRLITHCILFIYNYYSIKLTFGGKNCSTQAINRAKSYLLAVINSRDNMNDIKLINK